MGNSTTETPYGTLQVCNIHLHKGRRFFAHSVRVKQLKSILKRLQAQQYLPIILAGAFNENALMKQKKFVIMFQSRGLIHSVRFQQYERMPSYRLNNPLVDNWINREKYSRRLDYILVSLTEDFGLQVVQYEPIYIIPPLSDHNPIILSLSPGYE